MALPRKACAKSNPRSDWNVLVTQDAAFFFIPASPPQDPSAGSEVMILSVSGILLLGICISTVAWYVLDAGATKAARERVDTNLRVAWDVLGLMARTSAASTASFWPMATS
jgi:hypothetical protein